VRAPGSVKRLAVAVVLDQQAPVAASQVDTIQQLVTTAAGIDPKRGDLITVSALPFDRTQVETEQVALAEAARQEQLLTYLRLGALIGVPLLVLIALLIAVRMGRRPASMALAPVAAGALGGPGRVVVTDVTDPGQFVKDSQAASPNQQQVEFLARKDPAMIAQMVRTWLQEDERGGK
jgi:flagellar M-ring protein FliF